MGKQPRHFQSAMKGLRKPFAVIFSLAMAMSSLPVGALKALAEELEADNEGSAQAIVIDMAANDAETNLRAQAEGTEKPSVEPQEKSAAAAAAGTTLTYEDDTLVVTVTAAAGVLPQGARVEVEEIHPVDTERADAYGEALSALSESLRKEDKVYSAAKVYDIRLIDTDGIEFEPNGEVSVKIDYKQAQPMGDTSENVEIAHLDNAGELQMMGADVATNAEGEVETTEFTTDSFSYYIMFETHEGSETEPIHYGDYGWLKFATPESASDWGHYQTASELPATNTEEGYHRILKVNLHVLRNGGNETSYDDANYDLEADNQYFWTWENNVYISDFYVPGYEVVQTKMHTAWDPTDGSKDVYQDSLVGNYSVRGYRSSDGTSSDLNVLDVYMKKVPTPETAMRYIVRYVHADGSVTDGNVRYLPNGSVTIDVNKPRAGEKFSGIAVAAGAEAVTSNISAKTVTFTYNENVNLAKAYVYFEASPEENTTRSRGRYDKDADGNYYNGALGLYSDKTAKQINDREFMVNLEAWYVDNDASVGMVLDASGSMVWTAGVPAELDLDSILNSLDATTRNRIIGRNSQNNTISAADLARILDTSEVDNSNLGYNSYKYYVYTSTAASTNPINEYAPLGYWDGRTTTVNNRTALVLGVNNTTEGYADANNRNGAGWYYVNPSATHDRFVEYGSKRFEGIPSNTGTPVGASQFWVRTNSDGSHSLMCRFDCGSNDTSIGPRTQTSVVYAKRDQMMTKAETLQDSIGQFGAILNGASPDSEMAITRFSHRDFNDLTMLNWTSDSEKIAAAMDLVKGSPNVNGDSTKSDGTYQYGITGGTVSYRGFEAFRTNYKSHLDTSNNYKYLILFTDGKDQGPNDRRNGITVNNATNGNYTNDPNGYALNTRINLDTSFPWYTIITMFMHSVGMSDSDVRDSRNFLRGLASTDINGNKLFFEATSDNAHEVVDQFRQIAQYIVTGLQNYSVRDYVDPRFDVVSEAGQVLSVLDENGAFTHATNPDVDNNGYRSFTTPDGKQADLGYDSTKKMFYVLWRNQDIQASALNGTTVTPWQSQIRLRAKADFIGGNDVLTNGNEPGDNLVYKPDPSDPLKANTGQKTDKAGNPLYDAQGRPVPWDTADFPYAAVNPGLLDVALSNYEDTIYLGEEITPGELLSNMARTGTPTSRTTDQTNENRRVADSVYNTPAMTDAGDTDQSSIWYVEYLERLGKKLHNDAEYYFTLLKHVNLTGVKSVEALITAAKSDTANYTVTEAEGSVVIEGKANTPAAGEKITITKNTKIELELPYYYLECPTDPSSYAGPTTSGTDPMEDRVGTLTYTWELKDFAGNTPQADSKSEENRFVKFDTYVDSAHHMTTGDPKKDVTASVKYQFSIGYVPVPLTDDAKADGSGSTDNQGDGSERTRALTGQSNRVAAHIRNADGTTERTAGAGQSTTDEIGWAVVHAVDGRILIEKKMKTSEYNLAKQLKLTGTMTFTLTGKNIALDENGSPTDEVVWTKELSLADATVAKTDGDYSYLTLEGNWAEGLPQGDYELSEACTGAVKKKDIAAETVVFDTDASTDPAGPYNSTATNWAASTTGALTIKLGTKNTTPVNYEATNYSYAMVSATSDTYKNVDPKLSANDEKAYLNAQLGHGVVENELVPTSINVSKTWDDEDNIPTEGIVIEITGSNGNVYYVALGPSTSKTWTGTVENIPLDGATYTAQEGKGTVTVGSNGVATCSDFEAFGDTFELDMANGKKQFAQTDVTYADEANADGETAENAVTANTTPLAGTIAFTNGPIKTSIELTKVDAKDGATPLVGAKFQLKKKNADDTLTDVGTPQQTDEHGKLTFSNLQPNTTYVITETEAPEGWSRREDIEFEVLANGTVRLVTGYVENDPMAAGLGDPDANLKYPLTVPNTRTYALPAAGGPGVYPFLLAGAFAAAYAASGASDERRRTSGRKASRRRAAGPLGGD